MKKGYSLLEILITVTLLIILAVGLLVILNPMAQINKGQDSKRKSELAGMQKIFEDFYNDKQCYPKPSEVCYNDGGGTTCNICGNDPLSPSFSPYLNKLPCDPRQPLKQYLYQVDPDSASCPTWYRIYTTLLSITDPIIASVGCSAGCGPSPDFDYNYGVSSPNIGLESSLTACLVSGSCGGYCSSIGKSCSSGIVYDTYSDSSCQTYLGLCNGQFCCGQSPVGGQVQSYKCFCQ